MKTSSTEHYWEFSSSDNQGDYSIQIQKDGSQLRLTSEDGDTNAFIDVNKDELIAIRNIIDRVVKSMI